MFFQARIQHENIDGKVVKEEYLVDAESFTETEARLVKTFGVVTDDVISIRRSPIAELFHEHDAGDFYRAKVVQEFTDDNGSGKQSRWYFGLRALSTEEATKRVLAQLSEGYNDMKLSDIIRTKIIDVI